LGGFCFLTTATQRIPTAEALLRLKRASPTVLVSGDGASRTLFLIEIVEQALKEGMRVFYVDFDTAFTNFFPKHVEPIENAAKLRIVIPEPKTLVASMVELFSLGEEVGLIAVDSVSTMYHIVAASVPKNASRIAGLFVSMAAEVAQRNKASLIFTSFVRLKRVTATKTEKEGAGWVRGISGGRVLRLQAKEFLYVSRPYPREIQAKSLNAATEAAQNLNFCLHVDHNFTI
jgi:hypothetical protein